MEALKINLKLSSGSPHLLLVTAAATIVAGLLLFAQTSGARPSMFAAAAALSVTSIHLADSIGRAPRRGAKIGGFADIAAPAALCAGFAWILAGQGDTPSVAALRDGAILVLSGTLILTFASAAHHPKEWLIASSIGAAVAGSWLLMATEKSIGEGSTWAVAALAALAGVSIAIYPMIRFTIGNEAQGSSLQARAAIFWLATGVCVVLLAVSMTLEEGYRELWYLPFLSLSLFGLSLHQTRTPSGPASFARSDLQDSMAIWLGLLGPILAGTAATALMLAGEETTRRWGAAAITVAVLVVFATALTIISSLRTTSIIRLSEISANLLRQSRSDPLTGLANRRGISERFSEELQRAARFNHPLTIGLIDIDDFKAVNDTWGHQAGDAVLQHVARRLELELRQIDVIGRYGGEEFLMLLPETAMEGAWVAADRVLRSIREMPLHGVAGPRSVTISIGLATFPEHGRSETDLIASADEALYGAKRSGKNQAGMAGSANREQQL